MILSWLRSGENPQDFGKLWRLFFGILKAS